MAAKVESGVQLLARLGARPDLRGLEPALFGSDGPEKSSLVEFYGEEGTGKTQTIIHLIANSILPRQWCDLEIGGIDTGVVIVDTDYQFSLPRLTSILENRIKFIIETSLPHEKITGDESNKRPTEETVNDLMKECLRKLYIVRCNSTTQLTLFLYSLDSLLNSNTKIGLLIIDSISAFYWIDRSLSTTSVSTPNAPQQRLYVALKRVIDMYKICTIIVRAALFSPKNKEGDSSESDKWNYLGRQWQHGITLACDFVTVDDGKNQFSVSFTPNKGHSSVKRLFQVTDYGVQYIS